MVTSEVLTELSMKITVFWDVVLCSIVIVTKASERPDAFFLVQEIEAKNSSEKLATAEEIILRHVSEASNLYSSVFDCVSANILLPDLLIQR
jgi:hypothetical protein